MKTRNYSAEELANAQAVKEWQQNVSAYQGQPQDLVPENFTDQNVTVNGGKIVVQKNRVFSDITVRDSLKKLLFGDNPPRDNAANKICQYIESSGGIAIIDKLVTRLARHDGIVNLEPDDQLTDNDAKQKAQKVAINALGKNIFRYKIEWTYEAASSPALQATITMDIFLVNFGKEYYYLPASNASEQRVIEIDQAKILAGLFEPVDSSAAAANASSNDDDVPLNASGQQKIQGKPLLQIEVIISPGQASPTKIGSFSSALPSSSSTSRQPSSSANQSLQVTSIVMSSDAANVSFIPGQNTDAYKQRQQLLEQKREQKREHNEIKKLIIEKINESVQIRTTAYEKVEAIVVQAETKETARDAAAKTIQFKGDVAIFGYKSGDGRKHLLYEKEGSIFREEEDLTRKITTKSDSNSNSNSGSDNSGSSSRRASTMSLGDLASSTQSGVQQQPLVSLLTFTATLSYSEQIQSSSAATTSTVQSLTTKTFKVLSIEMTSTFDDVLIVEGQNTAGYKQAEVLRQQREAEAIALRQQQEADAAQAAADAAALALLGKTPNFSSIDDAAKFYTAREAARLRVPALEGASSATSQAPEQRPRSTAIPIPSSLASPAPVLQPGVSSVASNSSHNNSVRPLVINIGRIDQMEPTGSTRDLGIAQRNNTGCLDSMFNFFRRCCGSPATDRRPLLTTQENVGDRDIDVTAFRTAALGRHNRR